MSNIYFLKHYQNAHIYIKRDDLHPFSFGGNKVKIAAELFADLEEHGCNAVISYGSPASNMNRAVAHMAASRGLPCYVILKRDADHVADRTMSMNERLVRMSGAFVTECGPETVRAAVEAAMRTSEAKGERPYYIYGDSTGHGREEVLMRAYGKQYWPIREFEREEQREEGFQFSHIFLPVGTGATISGLAASVSEGCEVDEPRMQLHGISVARKKAQCLAAVDTFLASCGYDTAQCRSLLEITDRYVGEGYGAKNPAVEVLIQDMLRTHGLPLDPVYTGKAFYGMLQEIERLSLSGNILFIHTGGTPLFYDYTAGLRTI